MFEAIPERIEVSGHQPTWRVTGGSFESALDFARDAFGASTVVAREDRGRWWPRVTLTVTVDPALVAAAPPLELFTDYDPGFDEPEARVGKHAARVDEPEARVDQGTPLALEAMFAHQAHQEELRRFRRRIPAQRSPRS